MKSALNRSLLCAALLIAVPVVADPDPHAGHHPAATTPATAATAAPQAGAAAQQGCAMMSGGAMTGANMAPGNAMHGQMSGNTTPTAPMGAGGPGMMAGQAMPNGMMAGCNHAAMPAAAGATPPK